LGKNEARITMTSTKDIILVGLAATGVILLAKNVKNLFSTENVTRNIKEDISTKTERVIYSVFDLFKTESGGGDFGINYGGGEYIRNPDGTAVYTSPDGTKMYFGGADIGGTPEPIIKASGEKIIGTTSQNQPIYETVTRTACDVYSPDGYLCDPNAAAIKSSSLNQKTSSVTTTPKTTTTTQTITFDTSSGTIGQPLNQKITTSSAYIQPVSTSSGTILMNTQNPFRAI